MTGVAHFAKAQVLRAQRQCDEDSPEYETMIALDRAPIIRAHLASAYPLRGDTERAAAKLAEARRLAGEESFSSIAKMKVYPGAPKTRALFEATYFAGLRKGRNAAEMTDIAGDVSAIRHDPSFTSSSFTPCPACRPFRALSIRRRKRGSFSSR